MSKAYALEELFGYAFNVINCFTIMKSINPEDSHCLDKAITFLVTNYNKTGSNSKPVILHSLTVAFYLLEYDYDLDLVEAAILHDLIEDSDITKQDIAIAFGEKIAERVDALSFKTSINNKETRYKEMYDRVKKCCRETLIIKCADIYANSFYIRLVDNKKKQEFLIDKLHYFLNLSKELIGEEPVWHDLYKQRLGGNKRLSSNSF